MRWTYSGEGFVLTPGEYHCKARLADADNGWYEGGVVEWCCKNGRPTPAIEDIEAGKAKDGREYVERVCTTFLCQIQTQES